MKVKGMFEIETSEDLSEFKVIGYANVFYNEEFMFHYVDSVEIPDKNSEKFQNLILTLFLNDHSRVSFIILDEFHDLPKTINVYGSVLLKYFNLPELK